MKTFFLIFYCSIGLLTPALADNALTLTDKGISFTAGPSETYLLPLPNLEKEASDTAHPADHAAPSDVTVTGDTLVATYPASMGGAQLTLKLLDKGKVQMVFSKLGTGITACSLSLDLPLSLAADGSTFKFNDDAALPFPASPGTEAKIANKSEVETIQITWSTGESLLLAIKGWHALEDHRVWGQDAFAWKAVAGLPRDPVATDQSTLVLSISVATAKAPATAASTLAP